MAASKPHPKTASESLAPQDVAAVLRELEQNGSEEFRTEMVPHDPNEPGPRDVHSPLLERIGEMLTKRSAALVIAIDGRSGVGKSTLARSVAAKVDAVLIDGDDFYAGGSAQVWDAMTPAERVDHCIDWRRQRPVLEALRQGRPTAWRAHDWEHDDGRLVEAETFRQPAAVVILEGVYSARPELADLVDLTVLLQVPDPVRITRLTEREGSAFDPHWNARWASAEAWYFSHVMPSEAFDLVLQPLA